MTLNRLTRLQRRTIDSIDRLDLFRGLAPTLERASASAAAACMHRWQAAAAAERNVKAEMGSGRSAGDCFSLQGAA